MRSGLKHTQQEPRQRRMITREEFDTMQGAIEIIGADGCIGYYVVTQLCGQPVIWEGRRSYHADWDGYGKTWRAYKVNTEG